MKAIDAQAQELHDEMKLFNNKGPASTVTDLVEGSEAQSTFKPIIDLTNEPPPGYWLQAMATGIMLPRHQAIYSTPEKTVIYWDYDASHWKVSKFVNSKIEAVFFPKCKLYNVQFFVTDLLFMTTSSRIQALRPRQRKQSSLLMKETDCCGTRSKLMTIK